MTIAKINSLAQAQFVEQLGWIYEHSPWVAERAWARRPFADLEALHAAMYDQVEQASHDEKLALLCAHPDLGTRLPISAASEAEQAGAGFSVTEAVQPAMGESAEIEILQDLNRQYREKFDFPFIYAVKGSPRHDILLALQVRLDSTAVEEFHEALYQVYRIAYFRLTGLITSAASGK